ncbi:MAG: hypothetical protein M1833_005390 [Piccolia ochrophora]|nr:MAG: hypothetical protein M1833_005390 [Piccolia ochrophora]
MAEPLSVVASIAGLVLFSCELYQFALDMKDASKESMRILGSVASTQSVLQTLESLARDLGPEDAWAQNIQTLDAPEGPLHQLRSILSSLHEKLREASGLKKRWNRIAWPFKKGEVKTLLDQIGDIKLTLDLALSNDGIGLSRAIKADTTALNDKLDIACDGIDGVRVAQSVPNTILEDQRKQAIFSWLSPLNFPPQQADLIGRRAKGTGDWLLQSREFKAWKNISRSTLFCHGIRGSGKTVLASVVVDHLQHSMTDRGTGVFYVYCSYRNGTQQTLVNILGSLWKQLVQGLPSFPDELNNLYNLHIGKGTQPSADELDNGLAALINRYSASYVVIDALDECADEVRRYLLPMLRQLQTHCNVNIMATSRRLFNIECEFLESLQLEIRASDEDIRTYLDEQMDKQMDRMASCIRNSLEFQDFIKSGIVEAADGMFLLAELQFGSLHHKRTKTAIRVRLESLPGGEDALREAYAETLERINAQDHEIRQIAEHVLSWVTYAERELSALELQVALAVKSGDSRLDEDNLLEPEEMIDACAGLVTFDNQSRVVRLIHYTTKDYLIDAKCVPNAQNYIAKTCLTYLLFESFRERCESKELLKLDNQQDVLLNYAAGCWGFHIPETPDQSVEALAITFLASDMHVSNCWDVIEALKHRYLISTLANGTCGAHLCSWFGLKNLLHSYLESKSNPKGNAAADSKDRLGRTPLSYAAECGHEAVVRFLADWTDVDTDSKAVNGQTPLSRAAQNGHEAVVRYLADRTDVDTDSKADNGQTPLSRAAKNGHEAVVRYLADRTDVDTNSRDQWKGTPLSEAAVCGHEAVMRYLAERADVDAESKGGALVKAASSGHEGNVKYLAERADVDVESKGEALVKAASSRHEEIVKYLAERADVEADFKGRALMEGVSRGEGEIVQYLATRADIAVDWKEKALQQAQERYYQPKIYRSRKETVRCYGAIIANLRQALGRSSSPSFPTSPTTESLSGSDPDD